MIAAAPSTAFLFEPFNIRMNGEKITYWYTYISENNERYYYKYIKDTISFRHNIISLINKSRNSRDIIHEMKKHVIYWKYYLLEYRPIIKDPFAVFSSEWLVSKFDMDIIIMIRHPAAFAGSLKQKDWQYPFSHFLNQPLLLENYLHTFRDEIRDFAKNDHDIIDQAALLWKLIYYMVSIYKNKYPKWLFVRHEDISKDPINSFRNLFHKLNLTFTDHAEEIIEKYTSSSQEVSFSDIKHRPPVRHLDSFENIKSWKNRLTEEEVERVKSQVRDVAREFYSDEEW
jgi:hypothetical protein